MRKSHICCPLIHIECPLVQFLPFCVYNTSFLKQSCNFCYKKKNFSSYNCVLCVRGKEIEPKNLAIRSKNCNECVLNSLQPNNNLQVLDSCSFIKLLCALSVFVRILVIFYFIFFLRKYLRIEGQIS
jgi:hypothetical protein